MGLGFQNKLLHKKLFLFAREMYLSVQNHSEHVTNLQAVCVCL